MLCCFALFVCLTLLASFFHLSFKNIYHTPIIKSFSILGLQILALCDIIAASLALDDINSKDNRNIDVNLSVRYYPGYDWNWGQIMEASKGICGTLIFLSLLIMIIEGLVIAQRFLNVGLVERHNQAFIIAVSIVLLLLFLLNVYICSQHNIMAKVL